MNQSLFTAFWYKRLLCIFPLVLLSTVLLAQQTVRGKITDSTSNLGLPGINVTVQGTNRGTVTGQEGTFTIQASAGDILVISAVNYVEKQVRVGSDLNVAVSLSSRNNQMGEVVVIGYGTRQRKDLTGAVSQVTAKEIEKSTAVAPEIALQGRAAGVFVQSGGGAPNSRNTVRIRGISTFGNAEPLYVVDGLPIYEGGLGVTTGGTGDIRSPMNVMSLINANDIESITVLKDASAAAIYGVRASNGVILITTKKGRTDRPRVEVSSYYGVQNITKTYSMLNTQQYFDLVREAYNANPDANTSFEQKWGPKYNNTNPQYAGNGPTYDWQKELLNKNAPIQDHSVRLSGGSAATTYYISAGYTKQESPLVANDLERYSLATNLESKFAKIFSTGLTLRLVQENALTNTQTDLPTMATTIPFQPIYDPADPRGFAAVTAGTFRPNPSFRPGSLPIVASYLFETGPTRIWGDQSRLNVFAFHQLNTTDYDLYRAMGNAYIQIEPIQGLRLKATLGGDWYSNLRRAWQNFDNWRFAQDLRNPYARQDGLAKGSYQERKGYTNNLNKELILNFSRTFGGQHSIDFVASASDQFGRWSWSDLTGNVNFEERHYRNIGAIAPYTSGQASILEEDNLIGYMGRLSYKFSNKYYLDATINRNGSSRLAPGHKWDNFPSFAASWRISSESFFPKTRFITDLKLRGGWGKLGNVNSAGRYRYLSTGNTSPDYPLGTGLQTPINGIRFSDFANTNLTWEKVETASAGFDAQLFNNRLSLTAEYYNRTTFDIIQSVALPPNTGIQNNSDLNVATVRNRGIELQLGYNNNFGPVDFNASVNFTTTQNRVMKLNEGTPFGGNAGRVEEGYSMFYLWGYKVGGIFQNQQEIDAWRAANADATINQNKNNQAAGYQYRPGDMYFQDLRGNPRSSKELFSPVPDSLINANDQVYLGKTIPGHFYGFNLGASYKGFDFSAFFQGVGDVQKYNSVRADMERMSGLANQSTDVLERWTPTNPSTTMPRAVYNNPSNPSRFSDRYVENAGYMRLRVLQLGYSLPQSLLSRTGAINSIRFYVSGLNLLTLTKWKGIDPEVDEIPVPRQFLFGINASF